MRSTLLYIFMTAALGGTLIYTIHGSASANGAFRKNLVQVASGDPAPIKVTPAPAPVAIAPPATAAAAAAAPANDGQVRVPVGATRDEVIALLGQPGYVSADNARWTYGSHVIVFNPSGLVTGGVKIDAAAAAESRYADLMRIAAEAPTAVNAKSNRNTAWRPQVTASSAQTNLGRTYSTYSQLNGFRTGRTNLGSSRPYVAQTSRGSDFSYYSSNSARLNRSYFRKPTLPRGMMRYSGRGPVGMLPYRNTNGQLINPNGSYSQPYNSSYSPYRR